MEVSVRSAAGRRWCRLILWTVAFATPYTLAWYSVLSDIVLYHQYAEKILAGALPYRDVNIEYPPLAVVFFVLPRLLSGPELAWYAPTFVMTMGFFDTVQKAIMLRSIGSEALKPVLLHTAASSCLFYMYLERFDIVATLCVFAACVALLKNPQGVACWVLLALGASVKLFPIVVAPVLWCYAARRGVRRQRRITQLVSAAALGGSWLAAAWGLAGPASLGWLTFNKARGLHVASIYASLALLRDGFSTHWPIWYDYGSLQVHLPWADTCARWALWVTLLALVVTAVQVARRRVWEPHHVWCAATAMVAAMITWNKVYSPQYSIWLIPTATMAAWCRSEFRWPVGVSLALACALTACVHPGEDQIAAGYALRSLALVGRNGCVLFLWIYLTYGLSAVSPEQS